MSESSSVAVNTAVTAETIGTPYQKIKVELSTRFLEHFSEQLYASPQKAFEELISNGYDAGARVVEVRISQDLDSRNATLSVFDDGESMDEDGLRQLWRIANSTKEGRSFHNGRPIIGKFGIGKLATYVLANKLTYICKADDGKIRRVTMDYGALNSTDADGIHSLIGDIELDVYEVHQEELDRALQWIPDGDSLLANIRGERLNPSGNEVIDDEFCGTHSALVNTPTNTWTLVILSDLKEVGRHLKTGVLRRMLSAALPIGSEIDIRVNGKRVVPSKNELPFTAEWRIGPDLDFSEIELEQDGEPVSKLAVESHGGENPYMIVPKIGRVSGTVRVYRDRISGGKSDSQYASNGFHVNVLGRVINRDDPSFGEENLSHSVWARFRMAVRADGLNESLNITREQFRESEQISIFRIFLRKVFNKARTHYDADTQADLTNGGDVLVKSLGIVSLSPLRNVVSDYLGGQPTLPGLFDDDGIEADKKEATLESWRKQTADDIRAALGKVSLEKLDDDSFVKFRISDSSIVVNKQHPFAAEFARTKAEKELLRTIAMVDLLTDVYSVDIGVPAKILDSIRSYRDSLMRYRALERRESGVHIAKLLSDTQHDSSNSKRLESVVADALWYVGFEVQKLGNSGDPEGIARAFPTPTGSMPSNLSPQPPLYSVSYDAKASKHDSARTGNIGIDGVVEHRNRYGADYALIIAPGYQEGAITVRCQQQHVTPMTAGDLGRLLEYTAENGAIPLTKLREVFELYDPVEVSRWVKDLETWMTEQRPLKINTFLNALESLKGQVPDVLPAATLALLCRQNGAPTVVDRDVIALAKGLSVIVPDLVGLDGDKIVVNASAKRVAEAVGKQLESLHGEGRSHP